MLNKQTDGPRETSGCMLYQIFKHVWISSSYNVLFDILRSWIEYSRVFFLFKGTKKFI